MSERCQKSGHCPFFYRKDPCHFFLLLLFWPNLGCPMDCCNINCIAFCTQPDVVWQKGIYLDAWHAMALADRDFNGQQFEIYDALEVIHCACHQHYECLQPSSFTQCSFALICVVSFFLHPFIGSPTTRWTLKLSIDIKKSI